MKTLFLAGKQIAIFLLKYINNQAFRPREIKHLFCLCKAQKVVHNFFPYQSVCQLL
jgi:hypothetical protein